MLRGDYVALISVIMGIYNCAGTLEEAVGCIRAQTVQDWELIMCDDGSTDETYDVARKLAGEEPGRIRLLKNGRNQGLNYTLNRCLEAAEGRYIARMDADDRCSPDRFEKELRILESEPEIAIVSTAMDFFDEFGVWGRAVNPEYPAASDFLYRTPFCHAPCMVRREAYEAVGGYSVDRKLLRVEDYHLWVKMYAAGFRGKNLSEALYQMRDDRNATGRRRFRYRFNESYVKIQAVKLLHLPVYNYLYAVRPILVGLLPHRLYDILRKRKLHEG